MKIHEDERRTLIDTELRSETVKIIIAKQDCELGNHYHKKKTEQFILLEGSGLIKRDESTTIMDIGKMYTVSPNVRHEFSLSRGAKMICLVDKKYDPKDDYK